jgi:hypothetical protein
MMTRRRSAFALALSVAAPCAAHAQAGTAPIVLRIPAGPRSMALGDAYVAGSGAEVLFYNPARIIAGAGSMVALGFYGSEAKMGTVGTTLAVAGNFTAGFGVRYLEHGLFVPDAPPEPGDLAVSSNFTEPSLAATFGLAHTLPILGVQAGASVTYARESGFISTDNAFTFSVGVTQPVGSFTVAIAAQDFSGRYYIDLNGKRLDIPERVSLGVTSQSIPVGDFIDITPIAQVSVNRDHQVRPAGGVNFAYTPVIGFEFAARVGARWVDSTGALNPSPFSFGLGFTLDRLSLDYAFAPDAAGAAHRIGIRAR